MSVPFDARFLDTETKGALGQIEYRGDALSPQQAEVWAIKGDRGFRKAGSSLMRDVLLVLVGFTGIEPAIF
jgi:hypothetical protein